LPDGARAPSLDDEYLFYQSMIGVWPFTPPASAEERTSLRDRLAAYIHKAGREAKVHTRWTDPNHAYESAVKDFVHAAIDDADGPFMRDFLPFLRDVARGGLINALSQTILRLAAPGVPDTYQGTEFWDFSLVDPDNRRPVDYQRRAAALRDAKSAGIEQIRGWMNDGDDRIKLLVTQRLLTLRRDDPELFIEGDYTPLRITARRPDNLFAFARRRGDRLLVVVVPRLVWQFPSDWGDTQIELPPAAAAAPFRNVISDERHKSSQSRLPASELFTAFPAAVLISP
jgi:(1->4)-alpha-D-glucan 1-alpha-D-glucosylmutase